MARLDGKLRDATICVFSIRPNACSSILFKNSFIASFVLRNEQTKKIITPKKSNTFLCGPRMLPNREIFGYTFVCITVRMTVSIECKVHLNYMLRTQDHMESSQQLIHEIELVFFSCCFYVAIFSRPSFGSTFFALLLLKSLVNACAYIYIAHSLSLLDDLLPFFALFCSAKCFNFSQFFGTHVSRALHTLTMIDA